MIQYQILFITDSSSSEMDDTPAYIPYVDESTDEEDSEPINLEDWYQQHDSEPQNESDDDPHLDNAPSTIFDIDDDIHIKSSIYIIFMILDCYADAIDIDDEDLNQDSSDTYQQED